MDCFRGERDGKENPSSCYTLLSAVPYDGQAGDGSAAGIPVGRDRRKISGVCICRELLMSLANEKQYVRIILIRRETDYD